MKKNLLTCLLITGIIGFTSCEKEDDVVDNPNATLGFEELTLEAESYWNGADQSGMFTSSPAVFDNLYQNDPYLYWEGFSYSNLSLALKDSVMKRQYIAAPGAGSGNSANYVIFYQGFYDTAYIYFQQPLSLVSIDITNNYAAAFSMKNGDMFAKKFGGDSGNDPDWFKLSVSAFDDSGNLIKTADFFLADFRDTDNTKDYVLDSWKTIDLSQFSMVSKLCFSLSSSDVGDWGMNTPAYCCLDNIVYIK